MKKILLTVLITIYFSCTLKAQQDIMVSQYMFNGLLLNPAYAGSHKYFSSTLMHRSQWVGLEGAPKTSILAIDGPVNNEKMGIGLIVSNDRIGATDQTDIYGNYSYHLKLGEGKLAFGLRAGVSKYTYQYDKLVFWDDNDQVFVGNRTSAWLPKFGTGLYYYAEKWYAGLSVPTLIAYDPNRNFGESVNSSSFVRRHYYAVTGYVFDLGCNFKFKPSVLMKYVSAAPLEADLNAHFMYRDQFWFGASYRTSDAITAMVEYQTSNHFRFGYAYDFTTSKLRNYSSGTHEIMIGYDFGRDLIKVKTPRYF
ncbi:MAG TPA: type IX secretion system membrane protein PorP/SprF [Bacteroidia bacterium]|jgi:type IX secretion system PorP/SprF family membrane protein